MNRTAEGSEGDTACAGVCACRCVYGAGGGRGGEHHLKISGRSEAPAAGTSVSSS